MAAASAGVLLASPPSALASDPLGKDGAPIQTSQYTIDLYEGPVLAGSRIVAMSGAYTAIAEGVQGYGFNPAAVAFRTPWSTNWFDWEIDVGVTFPSSVTDFDFDNNGDDRYANSAAYFLGGGLGLQFGQLGLGGKVDFQQYHVQSHTHPDRQLYVNITRWLLLAGYTFLDGEITIGGGLGFNNVNVMRPYNLANVGTYVERQVAGVTGWDLHMGLLWAPKDLPMRIGGAFRFGPPPAAAGDDTATCHSDECVVVDGNTISGGYYLPNTITVPKEIHLGIAVQLWRTFNFGWKNPHDQLTAADRVEAQVERGRAIRARRAERRLVRAQQRGESLEPLMEKLEDEEDAAAELDDERIERAEQADREERLRLYKTMRRDKLLLSLGVKLTGITPDGVGLESFLEQQVERSGEYLTAQPSLGLEAEAVPGWLVIQAGGYLEPSRFAAGSTRVHGTAGGTIRLPFEWSLFGLLDDDSTFQVGGAFDGSARYFAWSVTAGLWR